MGVPSLLSGARFGSLRRAFALLCINTGVRGLGACAALVLAYGLGAGPDMDRYMAFSLLTVAFASLTASAMPALASRQLSGASLANADSVEACRAWAKRLAHVGTVAYVLALPLCTWAFDSSKATDGLIRLGLLLATGAPGLLLAPRVALEQALLQARGRFYAAGFASALFTGTNLLATFVAAWQGSVFWCTAGLLLGAWLEYLCLRRLNRPFDLALAPRNQPALGPPFPLKAFVVFTAASTGVFFSGLYDQALLARLGVGAQALWGLAGRAPSFITLSLFAVAGVLSTVLVVTRHAEGGNRLARDAIWLAAGMLVVSVFAMGALLLSAQPLTALLYERGAFTSEDTLKVAHVLRFAVWAYVLYPTTAVLVRAASAQALHRPLLVSAGAFLAVKLVLGWWAHSRLGIPGIAMATGLAMLAQTVVLVLALRVDATAPRVPAP